MRITCISDNHDQNLKTKWSIPEGDILIHAGDLVGVGDKLERFERGFKNLSHLPHPVKLYVPGNHDKLVYTEERYKIMALAANKGIIILFDREWDVNGIKFWGSGWTHHVNDQPDRVHTYKGLTGDLWKTIPPDTDILITHIPPSGILDWSNFGNEHIGDPALTSHIIYGFSPKYHIFGHAHASFGRLSFGETTFINASLCGEDNLPVSSRQGIVIDV